MFFNELLKTFILKTLQQIAEMPGIIREISSGIKEILSVFHYISTITFIAGLAAVAGSFEETTSYLLLGLMVPSAIVNVLTGIFMELLETRIPSVYRIVKELVDLTRARY